MEVGKLRVAVPTRLIRGCWAVCECLLGRFRDLKDWFASLRCGVERRNWWIPLCGFWEILKRDECEGGLLRELRERDFAAGLLWEALIYGGVSDSFGGFIVR